METQKDAEASSHSVKGVKLSLFDPTGNPSSTIEQGLAGRLDFEEANGGLNLQFIPGV